MRIVISVLLIVFFIGLASSAIILNYEKDKYDRG